MQGYPTIVRTGNPQLDLQTVEQHRRAAAAQGIVLLVQPLAGGGYQLVASAQPPPADPIGSTLPSNQPSAGAIQAAARASQPLPVPAQAPPMDPGGTLPSRFASYPYAQPVGAPQVQVILGPGDGYCETCRRIGPLKRVTFMQNVGALILRFPRTVSGQLCKFCIDKYFFRFTAITLIAGWWGVISFFYSLIAVPSNVVNWLGTMGMKTPQEDIESLRDRRGRGTALIAVGALNAALALLCWALGALVVASGGDAGGLVVVGVTGGVVFLFAAVVLFFGIRTRVRATAGLRRLGAA